MSLTYLTALFDLTNKFMNSYVNIRPCFRRCFEKIAPKLFRQFFALWATDDQLGLSQVELLRWFTCQAHLTLVLINVTFIRHENNWNRVLLLDSKELLVKILHAFEGGTWCDGIYEHNPVSLVYEPAPEINSPVHKWWVRQSTLECKFVAFTSNRLVIVGQITQPVPPLDQSHIFCNTYLVCGESLLDQVSPGLYLYLNMTFTYLPVWDRIPPGMGQMRIGLRWRFSLHLKSTEYGRAYHMPRYCIQLTTVPYRYYSILLIFLQVAVIHGGPL